MSALFISTAPPGSQDEYKLKSCSTLLHRPFLLCLLSIGNVPRFLAVPIQIANFTAAESSSLTERTLPFAGGAVAQGSGLDSQHPSFEQATILNKAPVHIASAFVFATALHWQHARGYGFFFGFLLPFSLLLCNACNKEKLW